MATIAISNLNLAGSDLFSDNESYLLELSDSELSLTETHGGSPIYLAAAFTVAGVTFALGAYSRKHGCLDF